MLVVLEYNSAFSYVPFSIPFLFFESLFNLVVSWNIETDIILKKD